MSWYWDDDYNEFYDDKYEELEAASDAIIFEGPLRARSRRGNIGETWWGEQWVAAMLRLGDARLDRGKSYARTGRVRDLTIQHGLAFAKVQGSRRKPYQSSFELQTFKPEEWEKALDALAGQAIYAAKLLAGEMPEDIEGVFNQVNLSLFPRSRRDIGFGCSCPDWGDPCKHCAAIYYLVAEQLDVDPFILFHMRGYTREQVLEGLRKRRGGAAAPVADAGQAEEPGVTPLDASLDAFWQAADSLPALPIPFMPSQPPMIARLGAPPDRIEHELRGMYQYISEKALVWLGGGNREGGEEGDDDDGDLPPLEEAIAYFSQVAEGGASWLLDMEDIARLADRERRFEGVLVDCYGPDEELFAMQAYLEEGLHFPFEGLWRDPDEPGHEEPVIVLAVYGSDPRRGLLLNVMRGKKKRRVAADQLWAVDRESTQATVLDDYRYWVDHHGGPMMDDDGYW
jgi:uncharacterized Zn finger protein